MTSNAKSVRFWCLQLALAGAWVAVWHWGRLLTQTRHASLWFPPAGLSFAMFLTQGPWAAVAVTAGAVVTAFQSAALNHDARTPPMLLASGLAFGVVHSLAYGTGAWLFDRFHGESRFGTSRAVFGFLLFSTLSALLGALGGISSLAVTGASESGLRENLIPWSIGDLVGVVTLAPLFLVLCDWAARRFGLASSGWMEGLMRLGSAATPLWQFSLKVAASAALALALAFIGTLPELRVPVALVAYALIVPLTWIALTEGAIRTISAVAILAGTVAAAALFGTSEQAFDLQAAMIVIAGTCLFNLTVPRLYADNRRLRDLVTFDQLTGAFARPVFFEIAERELQRARRATSGMALVTLDLDHFKDVNDTLGHGVGDQVLASVGRLCRGALRGGEVFGRIGGEEFAVVMPGTGPESASQVAERLRVVLEQADWSSVQGGKGITASFGVVWIAPDGESLPAAMQRADRAMYEAKRDGRNCVRIATEL